MASSEGDSLMPAANTLMDNFENAFQNCLSILIKEDNFNIQDKEIVRTHAENAVGQFMDCARQLEHSFLQKRLLLSVHRPDWIVKEDTQELKLELNRKDELIKKNQEKISMWKNLLSDFQQSARAADDFVIPSSGADSQRLTAMVGSQLHAPGAMMYRHTTPAVAAPSLTSVNPGGFSSRGGVHGGAPYQQQHHRQSDLASHLACLEKTTSNIGVKDSISR